MLEGSPRLEQDNEIARALHVSIRIPIAGRWIVLPLAPKAYGILCQYSTDDNRLPILATAPTL